MCIFYEIWYANSIGIDLSASIKNQYVALTHWGRGEIGSIWQYFKAYFRRWKYLNFDESNSLKFVPTGLINNIPSLVQIMAWRRPGDKSLSEPTMVDLLTHIYIYTYTYMCVCVCHSTSISWWVSGVETQLTNWLWTRPLWQVPWVTGVITLGDILNTPRSYPSLLVLSQKILFDESDLLQN